MEPTQHQEPHNGLKQATISLKDSSLSYIQSKAELAAIEAKEAGNYAKHKISLAFMAAFFGVFSYALSLFLIYGVVLQHASESISGISKLLNLNASNTIILLMMIFNFIIFFIYLFKLSKKPKEELFSLTKSEFQKDKQWLAEIKQTNEN